MGNTERKRERGREREVMKHRKITILTQLQVQSAKCLRRRTLNFVPYGAAKQRQVGRARRQGLRTSLSTYRDTEQQMFLARCGLALSLSQVSCRLGYYIASTCPLFLYPVARLYLRVVRMSITFYYLLFKHLFDALFTLPDMLQSV